MSSGSIITHQSLNTTSDKKLFVDNISCAIMSSLNRDSDIYNIVKEIRKDVNLKEESVASKHFHITLHQLNFNNSHPQTKKIRDNLKNIVKECYEIMFDNVDLLFNGYEIYGDFFVMKLKVSKELITDFRMCLYKNIEKILGVKIKGPGKHNKFIYETTENDNTPLYGLNEAFYYGKNNWAPHISLFKLNEKLISEPSKTVKDYIEEKGGNLQDIESIKSKFDSLKKYDKTIGFNNKNFFNIIISSYGAGMKNEIKTIDLKKGKKTKKLKSSIKSGGKKTKKKVHFKSKIKVIKFDNTKKTNIKNKLEEEPIFYGKKAISRKKNKKKQKNVNSNNKIKKGDKLQVYSNSNDEWCEGVVNYVKGKNVSVNFFTKNKPKDILTKIIPINSKDIKFTTSNKKEDNNFKKQRHDNTELHPNEIKLQQRNNQGKINNGKKVKEQRFVSDNTLENRVKKVKKKKEKSEEFGVFSWNVIMLVGAIIAPIFVYKDVMLNV